MKELLLEILGWLGYLERPTVLLQLGLVIAAVLLSRLARRRCWPWPTWDCPTGWRACWDCNGWACWCSAAWASATAAARPWN